MCLTLFSTLFGTHFSRVDAAAAESENIVLVAQAQTETSRPYIPLSDMDIVCGVLYKKVNFKCSASWQSGLIGSYVESANTSKCTRDKLANAIASIATNFASNNNIAMPGTFEWIAGSDLLLQPKRAPDLTYYWVVVECATPPSNVVPPDASPGAAPNVTSAVPNATSSRNDMSQ
jgi:hypothetical protein